jgi:hypothetical protein
MRVTPQFVHPRPPYCSAYSDVILKTFAGEVLAATVLLGHNTLDCSILLHIGPPISFTANNLEELLDEIGDRVRVECRYEEA